MNNGIYVGIVSFNPDIIKLKENIDSIGTQVYEVVVFDNGSINQDEIVDKLKGKIVVITSKANVGIAAALNRLLEWGEKNNYQWMISLDQDSLCSSDFVQRMIPYLTVSSRLGIVAPVIVDRNIGLVGHNPSGEYKEVRTCITSGAFNSIEAWREIGGYDEVMFIDSVDFEYCYRLRKNNYKVIQVRDVKLCHELGESVKRRFFLWKVSVNSHSSFRKYYIARNNIYYPIKHKLWLHFLRGNIRNAWLCLVVLLYEEDKKEKIKSILKGWKNGFDYIYLIY